jgi:hypothetical protein
LQAAVCGFEPRHFHHVCLVNSVARVPACLAGSRGFDSRTRRQTNRTSLAQLDQERRPTKPEVARSIRARGTNNFPIAQWVARLAVNQEVRGSRPRRGASSISSRCGADGSARDLGSRGRRFKPCHRDQTVRALGCGRSSMAELRVVIPLVPVRLRPVTPKRMLRITNNPSWRNRQTHRSQKPAPTGHVRSTRTEGTIHQPGERP